MNKRAKTGILAAGAAGLSVAILLAASDHIFEQADTSRAADETYQTETVQRGTVSAGISESGTVEFGTKEQIFSVAELSDVSLTGTDSSEDTESAGNSENTTAVQTAGMSAPTGEGGDAMTSGDGSSSVTGSDSSGVDTALVVGEVCVAEGQSVQAGEKLLTITQDSIDDYREALEQAVETAKLKVSEEEINAESKKTEADYTYQMYLAQGETAKETYDAAITELDAAVSELEEELAEAQESGDEDEIGEVEAQLRIAENNRSVQSIEAKQTYENAMTNYKYAQQLYEIDTEGLEDDLNEAKEELEEAQENLDQFEEQAGDGAVYAQYSGTITELSCAKGDTLVNDTAVAVFTDSDNVSMTVAVSQEDISQVTVGDEAEITLTAYEGEKFSGEVSSVATSAAAGSSTVNYEVEVRFTGDISKVYSGMTGDVTLGGQSQTDTLYIPNRAVRLEGASSMVKVLEEDGSIREAEITTGFSDGTVVAVESGLEEGETVIIESRVSQ